MIKHRFAVFTLAVALPVVAASTAVAADRYASPAGTGTTCSQAQPCDVRTAVESAGSNDQVLIYGDRGDYGISGGAISVPMGVTIAGIDGRPRLPSARRRLGLLWARARPPAISTWRRAEGRHLSRCRPAAHKPTT